VETSSKARAVIRAAASKPWMIRELFPCKPAFSRAVRGGHHRYLGPPAPLTRAMPPLWQYFPCLLRRQTSPWLPQRARIVDLWRLFPAKQGFLGGREWGATIPFMDSVARHSSAISGSRRRVVGEGDPPLWQYFSRLLEHRQADRCPQRARIVPRARLVAGSAQSCRCRQRSRV
jgi:hypothetical protein